MLLWVVIIPGRKYNMEKVFNLSEAFAEVYESMREKNENDAFDKIQIELEEADIETQRSFTIIEDYFNLYALQEENLLEWEPGDPGHEAPVGPVPHDAKDTDKPEQRKTFKPIDVTAERHVDEDVRSSIEKLLALASKNDSDLQRDPNDSKNMGYQPIEGIEFDKSIGSMKFPENIKFFIGQLVSWIKRVILYFIEKFKNLVRILTGHKAKELDSDDLKFRLDKVNKLKVIGLPGQYDSDNKLKTITAYKMTDVGQFSKYVPLFKESSTITEGWLDKFDKKGDNVNLAKAPVVISIDVSRDLISLEQLIKHFLDLFDNAYGSNEEYLFGTGDLEMLLTIFQGTFKSITNGELSSYEVGGGMAQTDAVSADRIKENLMRTKSNTDALKLAYQATSERISAVSQIIGHKQLTMSSNMGVAFKYFSSGTYQEMIKILDVINPRIEEASKFEKKLDNIQKKYNKLVIELQKISIALGGYGNIAYSTIYQRRISDLFNASRYMSQVITLRLAALGIYIKELKDIRATITNLNIVNTK